MEGYFGRYGAIARTDAEGRVRLQQTENNRRFRARHGDLRGAMNVFGGLPFASELTTHKIELERPVSVELQIVDTAGRPQPGIELSVSFGASGGRRYRADSPDAHVRICKPLGLADDAEWRMARITPRIFGIKPESTVIDMLAATAQPLQIVCPPTGRLLVETPQSADLTRYGNRLMLVSTREARADRATYSFGLLGRGSPLPDGRFLFPFVALGQEFTAPPLSPGFLSRFPPTPPGGIKPHAFAGPTSPGETVSVVLQPDADCPVLTAVLRGPNGKRWANRRVHVEIEGKIDGRGFGKVFHLSSDNNARFELPLPRYLDTVTPSRIIIRIVNNHVRSVGPADDVKSPTFHLGKRADLGEVIIAPPPHVVTIYVSGPDGWARAQSPFFHTRERSDAATANWKLQWPIFEERLHDGGLAYYSHLQSREWRVVFGDPDLDNYQPEKFAAPIEFEPGNRVLKVGLPRRGK